MASVLVIDDNETIRFGLRQVIKKMGHIVHIASSGAKGLESMSAHDIDFVITDLKMDGMDGVEVLKRIQNDYPHCPTMIITAFGSVETAVDAMKLGAFDFIQKPFAPEVVQLKVTRGLELAAEKRAKLRLESENEYLRSEVNASMGELVGNAPSMQPVFKVIQRVAPTESSVFILGESGTGKELVARAVHEQSQRAAKPFIKVNCGALTESLLESELFGHEKGAFTGAIKRRLGRFELADGGTLFLDEIGDITPSMQLKLLRVLQEQEFERVGGEQTIKVNVRIIAATNKDMQDEVQSGRFREDLFYRLHVVPIAVPALRKRIEDIGLLANHFIQKLAPKTNPNVKAINDEALARLMAYQWPGNVRELENAIEQSLVFAEGDSIGLDALPDFLSGNSENCLTIPKHDLSLPEILEDLEKQLILKAFQESNAVKTETARRLGIKTSALYYKLEKYGIE